MFDPQNLLDLQEEDSSFLDSSAALPRLTDSQFAAHLAGAAAASTSHRGANNGSLDHVLFQDLVEIVPLVQSLIDRKANSSFTRRGSIVYTKTPSREALSRKANDHKKRNGGQSIPAKKKRDHGEKDRCKDPGNVEDADNFTVFTSGAFAADNSSDEVIALREQVKVLENKLLEKDEILKELEISQSQNNAIQAELDEMKQQVAEKDSLIRTNQLQLSDIKIKLADKQAALERTQWEAMTSKKKAEKLQEELDATQTNISSLMMLFEGLTKSDTTPLSEDYDIKPTDIDYNPDIDDMDETDMLEMEEARLAYIAAVSAAKEKRDEESIIAAALARQHLQFLLVKPSGKKHLKKLTDAASSDASSAVIYVH